MSFWAEPQGAARLKLGILKRYLGVFAAKTGSTAPNRRVCYFDGYAGQGFYEDGSPGSPATAATAAAIYRHRPRTIDGFLVEKDPGRFVTLTNSAEQGGWGSWQLREGEASQYVSEMLTWAGSAPLLAFIDPFALGVPYAQLVEILSRAQTTEVLLNVSKHGIRRFSGHLTGHGHAARDSFIEKMDTSLGGQWWRDLVLENEASDEAARDISSIFCQRIAQDSGCGRYVTPIKDRLDGPIDYYLLLLTRHPDGLWLFNEAVSKTVDEEKRYQAETNLQFFFDETDALINRIYGHITSDPDQFAGYELRSKIGPIRRHNRACPVHPRPEGLGPTTGAGHPQQLAQRHQGPESL